MPGSASISPLVQLRDPFGSLARSSRHILSAISMIALGATATAPAAELGGSVDWDQLWLESGARLVEPRDGEFTLSGARLGARWTFEDVSARVGLGTRNLVARPWRYPGASTERSTDLVVVDAWLNWKTSVGDWRFGQQDVPFGIEAADDSQRRWTRSLILKRGLVALRDLGLGYRVESGVFASQWLVHNGESGSDLDRETWFTAKIEWENRNEKSLWRATLSGQTGRTTPTSTAPAGVTSSALELVPTEKSHVRLASLGVLTRFQVGSEIFEWLGEGFGAEVTQDSRSRRWRSGRSDLTWEASSRWAWLLRYEVEDEDLHRDRDSRQEASLGLQFYSLSKTGRALLVATKSWPEVGQAEHRGEVLFRFSPELF
ncbi:MAG TPA: hypothetical protein PLZ57_05705 [Pseudobdellovibrionaceae bacterium]|nr:hypothetical protein [Pseudobdellovibrionaceae bacterium]